MKVIALLVFICALTAISAVKFRTQTKTNYDVQLQWVFDPSLGYLAMSGSGTCTSNYQSYCDQSDSWTFAPGDWEIGQAFDTLQRGKSLYLSVQFLGIDQFSRYDLASSLGLDYFTLAKSDTYQIDEYF